jgi:hypothetical protein
MKRLEEIVPKILSMAKKPKSKRPKQYRVDGEVAFLTHGGSVQVHFGPGQIFRVVYTKELGHLIQADGWITGWQEISRKELHNLLEKSKEIGWGIAD